MFLNILCQTAKKFALRASGDCVGVGESALQLTPVHKQLRGWGGLSNGASRNAKTDRLRFCPTTPKRFWKLKYK